MLKIEQHGEFGDVVFLVMWVSFCFYIYICDYASIYAVLIPQLGPLDYDYIANFYFVQEQFQMLDDKHVRVLLRRSSLGVIVHIDRSI